MTRLKIVLTGTPMRSFCAPNQPSRVPTDERALADELLAQHNQECHTKLRLLTRHLRYKFTAYLTPNPPKGCGGADQTRHER